MFVDEPHVKYGENYTPSTVHFNYGRPKRRKQTNNPIWLDISRHTVLTHLTHFDSQHSIEAKKHRLFFAFPGGQEGPREGSQLEERAEDDDGSGEIPLDAQGGRRWNVDGTGPFRWSESLRSLNDTTGFLALTNTVYNYCSLGWFGMTLSYKKSWSLPHSHVGSWRLWVIESWLEVSALAEAASPGLVGWCFSGLDVCPCRM